MTVLMTTDGSPRSFDPLPHARRLGEVLGVPVEVATVEDGHAGELVLPPEMGHATLDPVSRLPGESVAAAILRTAESRSARVLAMATRGAGAIRHAALGSVALDVLASTPLPVLMTGPHIAPPRPAAGVYHVMVATDCSVAAESIIPALLGTFSDVPRERVRVTILGVYLPGVDDPPAAEAVAGLRERLSALSGQVAPVFEVRERVRPIVALGGVDTAIIAGATEAEADVIWMATRGHSRTRHLVLGSVALGVVSRSPLPVALVRASAP